MFQIVWHRNRLVKKTDAFRGVLSRLCRSPKTSKHAGTIRVATLSGVHTGQSGQIGIRKSAWIGL